MVKTLIKEVLKILECPYCRRITAFILVDEHYQCQCCGKHVNA